MIAALLVSAVLVGAGTLDAPDNADAMIEQITQWLLNGESLPADMPARLRRLQPADRMKALVFLRRSGMYDGATWSSEQILAPAETEIGAK